MKQFPSYRKVDYASGPELLTGRGGHLSWLTVSSFETETMLYIHFYDAASVDDVEVGTTVPMHTFPVPPEQTVPIPIMGVTFDFANGLVYDITTDKTGDEGAPGSQLIINGRRS